MELDLFSPPSLVACRPEPYSLSSLCLSLCLSLLRGPTRVVLYSWPSEMAHLQDISLEREREGEGEGEGGGGGGREGGGREGERERKREREKERERVGSLG